MTLQRLSIIVIILLTIGNSVSSSPATPDIFACPVSTPAELRPQRSNNPFERDASLYYEDGLWVTIPEDGVLRLTSDDAIAFGPLVGWRSATVTWLRDEGVEGFVIVSGQRLDAMSELSPQTPLSPQRQYVRVGVVQTGLAFPSEGCWEVIGMVGERELRFVVEVRFDDYVAATPSA